MSIDSLQRMNHFLPNLTQSCHMLIFSQGKRSVAPSRDAPWFSLKRMSGVPSALRGVLSCDGPHILLSVFALQGSHVCLRCVLGDLGELSQRHLIECEDEVIS